ncbi:hypothetical protein [Streptomyces lunalinharesii]|uniref:Leucine-binding protein domain-containing protein n=1 Tax=Streptomyces lunalinharesii TaxID=333384 RepID=A0ABN3SEV2_9ACTN
MRSARPTSIGEAPPASAHLAPSPRIPQHETDAYGPFAAPAPHTDVELAVLLNLLASPPTPGDGDGDRARRHRRTAPAALTIGHSRDDASAAAAAAFAEAWRAAGGTILALVDWPELAASWLRPARRFTAGEPDAWVVAAAPLGWAQMSRRLRRSTAWDPSRTYGFASLGDSRLVALAGPDTLHGMRGATPDGGTWLIDQRWVTRQPPRTDPGPT